MSVPLIIALLLLPAPAPAQTAPAPPAGESGAKQMVRAAGMPLNDGALPPGSLTVRIVQGAFSGNLSGLDVDLDVAGEGAKRAQTGAEGRAEFAHLPIGATVHASVMANGERLESESFPMPAESGVRLLLVAGGDFVDTTTAAGARALPPPGGAPSPGSAADAGASPVPPAPPAADEGVATLRVVMVLLTIAAFAMVGLQQWRRRSRR